MNEPVISEQELAQRRAAARKPAIKLAILVGVIFTVFFLTGVIGRGG